MDNSSSSSVDSLSPPPGRPGHMDSARPEKRDRESTGSNSSSSKSKVPRKVSDWSEVLEKAVLVTEATVSPSKEGETLQRKPDCGLVFSVSGTPAKSNLVPNYPDSPIITSKSSKK